MAGPEYLHHGALIPIAKTHLQRSAGKHLPRHKRLQPSQHLTPFRISPPRPSGPLSQRRRPCQLYRPYHTTRLWRIQSWLLLRSPQHLDRSSARYLVGPCWLRAKAYGVGTQRTRCNGAPLHQPAMDKATHSFHPAAKDQ